MSADFIEGTETEFTPGKAEAEDGDEFIVEILDDRSEEDQERSPLNEDGTYAETEAEFDAESDPEVDAEHEAEVQQLGGRAEKRIKKLTWEREEARRGKEAAERMQAEAVRFAEQQRAEVEQLRELVGKGEEVLLSEMRRASKSEVERTRALYRSAVEEGDFEAITAAQEAFNQAQIEKFQSDSYTPSPKSPPQERPSGYPARVEPNAEPTTDVVFDAWRSENQWFQKDRVITALAMAIHTELQENTNITGVSVGSEEYYNRIDSRMKQRFPEKFGNKGKGEPAAVPPPSVVATGKRQSGNRKRNTVQLTPTQASLAKKLGLTKEMYAREVLKLDGDNN